jgi:antitoxin ParD1/3/4
MTVEIPPDLQQFVQSAIDSGTFHNESEVVGEALRLLQQRENRLQQLRAEVQPALERLDRGEGIDLDDNSLDASMEDVKARARRRPESG